MKTIRFVLLIAASVWLAPTGDARDLQTVSGEFFKNIVVSKKDATGIRITHDDGVAFVDFKNLPDAEQKEFGYDPATYAAGQQAKIAAEKRRRELAARQAAAAKTAAAKASADNAQDAVPETAVRATPTARGLEVVVGTPGFKYGKYRIESWSVTNGVPTGTGGTLPGQTTGGYVTPPFVRQR